MKNVSSVCKAWVLEGELVLFKSPGEEITASAKGTCKMQCTRLLQSVPRQRSVLRGYSATPHLLAKIRPKQVKPKAKGKPKLGKVKLATVPPLPKGSKLTKEQRKEEEAMLKKVLAREAEGPYLSLEDQAMYVPPASWLH